MDIPEYHIPFGPNWFCPQIIAFSKNLDRIGIGINDSVHIMNFKEKKPIYDLFAPQNEKNRVTAILFKDDESTYVAYQNNLAFFQQNQLIWKIEIQLKNILYIIQINSIYLLDQTEGIFDFQNKKIIHTFSSKLKNYNQNIIILENKIIVYSQNFEEKQQEINIDNKILDSDFNLDQIILLVKEKFKIEVVIYKEFKQIKKFEIQFKLSLAEKPSLCIRFYNQNIIITGTKGEIFQINNIYQQDLIVLDSNTVNTSYEGIGDFNIETLKYQTFLDNPHFKPIYQIYNKNQYLICLSQDRKISFWSNNKLYYLLDLLSCSDNTIKKWNLKKQDYYYSQNIWKQLNNIRIQKICFNQKQEGILALSTDNQLGLYDICAQKLIKLTENLNERIINIYWIDSLFNLNDEIKIVQYDKSYTKILNQNQQILAILETKIVVWNQNKFQNINLILPSNFSLNSCDFIQENLNLLALGSKQGRVLFQFLNKKVQECQIIEQKQPISALNFKLIDDMLLIAVGCFDRTIYIIQLFINDFEISYQMLNNFKHKSPIQKLNWGNNFEILAIGYHNSCIQIWSVDPELDQQKEIANIRGHRGYVMDAIFINENKVVSCSDDQSLKIWDLSKCKFTKQQNKKKRKKVKLEE